MKFCAKNLCKILLSALFLFLFSGISVAQTHISGNKSNSFNRPMIAPSSVSARHIKDRAVTSAKIQNGTVQLEDMDPSIAEQIVKSTLTNAEQDRAIHNNAGKILALQTAVNGLSSGASDSADGVEITFARQFEHNTGAGAVPAIDLNGTALKINSNEPTVTLGGRARRVLASGDIPGTSPRLQQVIIDLPATLLAGNYKLKLSNARGYSETVIPLSEISGASSPDSNTVLLVRSNHPDNSTDFVDLSPLENQIIRFGAQTTRHDINRKKIGASSIFFFDGGLEVPALQKLIFNTDFTIDLWVRPKKITDGVIIGQEFHPYKYIEYVSLNPPVTYSGTAGMAVGLLIENGKFVAKWGHFYVVRNHGRWGHEYRYPTYNIKSRTLAAQDRLWYHLAFVRSGNKYGLYVNGLLEGSLVSEVVPNSYGRLFMGGLNVKEGPYPFQKVVVPGGFHGWVDGVRISNVACWTENFTPPTTPYR